MQQPGPMYPVMPSVPPTNITTEQIQKYLDENKKLILAILDNQHLGKLVECSQYQAQLQKNLMYLAAIADAQPQTPAMPSQMTPHPAMQQGGFYVQHPHPAAMAQASPSMFQRPPFSSPHPLQDPQNSQQVHPQGLMGLRPIGTSNGMNTPHADVNLGVGSSSVIPISNPVFNDVRKQDKADGQGSSAPVIHGGDGEEAK